MCGQNNDATNFYELEWQTDDFYIDTNTCELTGDRINHWTNQVLSLNRWTMQYRFISLLTPKNIELDCFRYFYLKIQKKYLSN